jgi:hypothetical protein
LPRGRGFIWGELSGTNTVPPFFSSARSNFILIEMNLWPIASR